MNIQKHVELTHNTNISGTHRCGTVFADHKALRDVIGQPHEQDHSEGGLDGAGKVHVEWYLETPRGTATIYDYWWNERGTLSIGAHSRKGALWVAKWLRQQGVKAAADMGYPQYLQ